MLKVGFWKWSNMKKYYLIDNNLGGVVSQFDILILHRKTDLGHQYNVSCSKNLGPRVEAMKIVFDHFIVSVAPTLPIEHPGFYVGPWGMYCQGLLIRSQGTVNEYFPEYIVVEL